MDDFVSKNLKELNIPQNIIQEFKDQGVDEDAFLCLSENMVRELCLPIGHRAKILKRITELKSKLPSNVQNSSSEIPEEISVFNIFADGNLSDVNNLLNSHGTLDAESSILGNQNCVELDNCIIENKPIPKHTEYHYTSIDAPSTSSTIYNFEANATKHTIIDTASDAAINLKVILSSYHDGQIILENYANSNKLNGQLRNKLSHIIITHFLKKNVERKISTEKLITLSQEICQLFPNENKETYYIPYKKEASVVSSAGGKLWDKYNNLRKEIRKTNQISNNEIKPKNICIPNEELAEDIIWLKNNISPWNIVENKWLKTFQERYNYLLENVDKNSCYLADYPPLKSPLGFTLIDLDFSQLYPQKTLIFFTKFEIFKNKLPSFITKNNLKGIDCKLIDAIINPPDSGIDTVVALKVFVELFKPINVSKRTHIGSKKSFIRPSKLEIQQSFIYYVNAVSQLKEVDEEKSNKALRTGDRLQPYMIFVEADSQVTYFYVVINNYYYKVESALKAIDICFKSFFVFHLNYTPQCEQIWYFIQKFFFEIVTKFDKNCSQNVINLINEFNKC